MRLPGAGGLLAEMGVQGRTGEYLFAGMQREGLTNGEKCDHFPSWPPPPPKKNCDPT